MTVRIACIIPDVARSPPMRSPAPGSVGMASHGGIGRARLWR
jgi:hypothetical protein